MYNSILHFKRKEPHFGKNRKSEVILLNMRINTNKNYVNAGFLSEISGFRADLFLGFTYPNKYGGEEIVQQWMDEALHKIKSQFIMNTSREVKSM